MNNLALAGAGFVYAFLAHVLSGISFLSEKMLVVAAILRAPIFLILEIERVVFKHDKLSDVLSERPTNLWPEAVLWCLLFAMSIYLLVRQPFTANMAVWLKFTVIVIVHLIACFAALLIVRIA
jgi:hypothetical protein